ncbi:MAG TPA: DUF1993 domain-containing protein [Sphingobium sp.]
MAIDLYQATVPQLVQLLTAAIGNLDKAQGWAKEQGLSDEDILGKSIAPDMWPLAKQFQVIAGHSAGAVKGAIAGAFSPNITDAPRNFGELRALLSAAIADLKAVTPEEVNAAEDKDVVLEIRGNVIMRFKGGDFLLTFAQPNFYFHVTAAYAILRGLGAPVGKRDYLGTPRVQQPA